MWIVGALGVVGVVAGCGGSTATTIDATRLNMQISTGLSRQLTIPAPQVRCPTGQANRQGSTFRCSTSVDEQALSITAAVSDNQGNVKWQPSDAVLSTSKTVTAIEHQLGTQLRSTITADCGKRSLVVIALGASITCTATERGSARKVTVTARDLAGNVDLSLAPLRSGPQSSTPPITAGPTPPAHSTLPGG
ncbi:MAG: DUF4333 domain-containing protein [Actinomycetota bacterium]|nr:DUF4333 domain-containing protein [Actinomycetota bacterium]